MVEEELNRKVSGFEKYMDQSGVGVVKIPSVKPEKFDTGNPDDKVYLTNVFSLEESGEADCGVMEMKNPLLTGL